jgi:hypothetical protein
MKIRKASLKRLAAKYCQLKHDGKFDHRIPHLQNALKNYGKVKGGKE